jgi:hypothetical protein
MVEPEGGWKRGRVHPHRPPPSALVGLAFEEDPDHVLLPPKTIIYAEENRIIRAREDAMRNAASFGNNRHMHSFLHK